MSVTRASVITACWFVVVFGVFAATRAPMSLGTFWILLFAIVAPSAIFLVLARTPRITLAEVIAEERRLARGPDLRS